MLTAGAATAATGGMTAGEGQVVVTGDSSASVQVTNVINADGEGGTSHTEIIKTVDGNTTKEVVDKTYAPGEPVITDTRVTATSGNSTTTGTTGEGTTTVEVATNATAEVSSLVPVSKIAEGASNVLTYISQLFHSVIGIFF